jgi:hypothetical protein
MVPICDKKSEEIDYENMDVEKEDGVIQNVISLVDGYALDIKTNSFCKLEDKEMIDDQIRNTYMNDYPKVEKEINFFFF